MLKAKEAAFSFESFKVPKFSYDESNYLGSDLKLGFLPSGLYDVNTGKFELTLKFITHEAETEVVESAIFELTAVAVYKFDQNIQLTDIPDFFYKNAIAIMFPYLRAFISTLTLQANTKLMKLGLMNLSELEMPLRANTTQVEI